LKFSGKIFSKNFTPAPRRAQNRAESHTARHAQARHPQAQKLRILHDAVQALLIL
jgi:hypothetical protein